MEHMQQGQHVLLVAALLRLPDIIDNHVADFFGSMLLAQKTIDESCGRNFWQMLVLGDGKNLLFGQATERNAVLHGNHTS